MEIPKELLFLLPVIVGVAEWLKQIAPQLQTDKWKWITKVVTMGLAIGGAFLLCFQQPSDWSNALIMGVILGLSANGLYDYAKPVGSIKPLG